MTDEDQAWVQLQISEGLVRHNEVIRPVVDANTAAIERNKVQITGTCGNLTNHEQRIVAIEDEMS